MAGKNLNLMRCVLLAAAMLCLLMPLRATADAPQDSDVKSATYVLGPVHIDKKYISMTGPVMRQSVTLAPAADAGALWVTGFRAAVVDGAGAPQSSEYLCHAWVTLGKPTGDDQKLLTISEGLDSMKFPPGFAVRVDGQAQNAQLLAQALNNTDDTDKNLSYKLTLDYLDDATAAKYNLRPLRTVTVAVMARDANPVTDDICRVRGQDVDAPLPDSMGGKSIVHFDVPPGRHEYASVVDKTSGLHAGGTVHYIKLHLHPYGESISLFDKTAGRALWTGNVKTRADRVLLTDVDYYSSTDGIRIDPAHDYEVRTVYNNTTGSLIDAMAVLRVYMSGDPAGQEKP